ncbi:hypothetical protein [Paenibacillus turpanensis]|uniref:hypothetical protein n=1 Tax=Paenibacillus turpanensis TaxID=2689078 RepID=UPI00140B5ADF|nr:hypothetical protein [Paenibacillus turpanensis]
MADMITLPEMKEQIKKLISYHSDRGFLHYGDCNRVCDELIRIAARSKMLEDQLLAMDIQLHILAETAKLISHADTSSGAAGDTIDFSLEAIEECSKSAPENLHKAMFDSLLKTVKKKAFSEWKEVGYKLLRSAVYLVQDQNQAKKVYELFPILGNMYGGKEYPDRYLITHGIIERLEGEAASEQYLLEHLEVPEIRMIVVKRAIAAKNYDWAEKLAADALRKDRSFLEPSKWAYALERIYAETGNREKRLEMARLILLKGDTSFYRKIKELCSSEEIWEEQREALLQELSKAYMYHIYADLLSKEGEEARLLQVVQEHPNLIEDYGRQLSVLFPEETYTIYENYIEEQAATATDRRKYKGVCKLIRGYSAAGAKTAALAAIQRLIEKYPRRPAMVDELEGLRKKLVK